MAHTGIFATAAECASKAGRYADSVGWTEANINQWCSEAESYINSATRKNWSGSYATLSGARAKILTEAESNLVALYGIIYNMGGYTTRVEAEDMLKTLEYRAEKCIELLKDQNTVKFIEGSS